MQKNVFLERVSRFNKNYFILYALIAVVIVFSFATPKFFTPSNMITILRQTSITAVIAAGQYCVLIGGDLDLSVGANVTLSGIIFSGAMVSFGINPVMAVLLALIVGLIIGMVNGIFVTKCKMPAFIATMSTMMACQGLALLLTGATPISKVPDSIGWIGRGAIGDVSSFGIPYMVIIMFMVFICVYIVTEKTNFGRYIFAMGGNAEAAYLSGVNIVYYKIYTYLISGAIAALASIMMVSRLGVGDPYAGEGYDFESITACVIGGTAIKGGKGKIFGVLFGALFLSSLFNGMTQMNVNTFIQQILKGAVLAAAVGFDAVRNKKD